MANAPPIMTWYDALEHCRLYVGGGPDSYNQDHFYKATQSALRELTRANPIWNYYWTKGWVNLEATYDTGTIAYDHTGGTYERQVTLTTGTVPTNVLYYMLLVDNVAYKVEDRKSSSVFTLTADSNPGADVASGTSYQLFRSEYTLPTDWRKTTTPLPKDWHGMRFVSPEELYAHERVSQTSGTPFLYTITSDTNLYGSMAIHVNPAPSEAKTLAFMYQRWPRQLKISGVLDAHSDGTVTTDGTTTVEGSGTSWTSGMAGSIIRFGDATDIPTAFDGPHPPADERVIISVTDSNTLVVDAAVDTLSAVKYRISDPIDLHQGMFEAYLRNCEKQLNARQRDYTVMGIVKAAWEDELRLAMSNDHAFAGAATSGEDYEMPYWRNVSVQPARFSYDDS